MEINIVFFNNLHKLSLDDNDSIINLKHYIVQQLNLPPGQIQLNYNGILLLDDKKLSDYKIKENESLNLISDIGFSRD